MRTGGAEALLCKYGGNRSKALSFKQLGKWGEIAFEKFRELYLSDNRIAAERCWLLARAHTCAAAGAIVKEDADDVYASFPSCASFLRALKARHGEAEICLAREGFDAYNRKHNLHSDRDHDNIVAGRIWFSDHHKIDVLCQDSMGNPVRPWLTVWRDMRTGYWLSWHLREEDPSSEIVSQVFADGVRSYGKPTDAIIDNGKDYRARSFAGGRKVDDEARERSMLMLLGVTPHFTIPYHGQSKTLERDFRTFCDGFSKLQLGYVGNKPGRRPESLAGRLKSGTLPTIAEMRAAVDVYVREVFHREKSNGKVLRGRSRAQAWAEEFRFDLPRVAEEDLRLLHARLSPPRQIRRGGVEWEGHRWFHENLILKNGTRVYLRIPFDNANGCAIVHDAETHEALCEARCDALRTPALARTAEEKEIVSSVMRTIRATEKRLKANVKVEPLKPQQLMADLRTLLNTTNPIVPGERIAATRTRILGRTLAADIANVNTGEVLAYAGQMIDEKLAKLLIENAIDAIQCEHETGQIVAITPMTEARRAIEVQRSTGTDGYTINVEYERKQEPVFSSLDLYDDLL